MYFILLVYSPYSDVMRLCSSSIERTRNIFNVMLCNVLGKFFSYTKINIMALQRLHHFITTLSELAS